MLTTTKQITYNGSSSIENKTVVTMHASVQANGNVSVSETIIDKDAYIANYYEVDSDISEFRKIVYEGGGLNE